MKQRSSYVSNSSSTSFIVGCDLTPKGICCVKLTRRQVAYIVSRGVMYYMCGDEFNFDCGNKKKRLHTYINDTIWMMKNFDSLYLTELVSDSTALGYRGKHVPYMYGLSNGMPYDSIGTKPGHPVKVLDNGAHSVWIGGDDDPPIERAVPMVEAFERINSILGDKVDMVVESSDMVKLMSLDYENVPEV